VAAGLGQLIVQCETGMAAATCHPSVVLTSCSNRAGGHCMECYILFLHCKLQPVVMEDGSHNPSIRVHPKNKAWLLHPAFVAVFGKTGCSNRAGSKQLCKASRVWVAVLHCITLGRRKSGQICS